MLPANTGLDYDGYVSAIVGNGVTAVETAGGNPSKYIERLKGAGIKVVHKCVTVRHALKAESLGVDAVSIDGFECAGHPGEDDVPGLVLIPLAASKLKHSRSSRAVGSPTGAAWWQRSRWAPRASTWERVSC